MKQHNLEDMGTMRRTEAIKAMEYANTSTKPEPDLTEFMDAYDKALYEHPTTPENAIIRDEI